MRFIIILIVFSAVSLTAVDFHFAVLGDRTGTADQEAFEIVVWEIDQLKPEFIVTVGDLIEDCNSEEDWMEPLSTLEQLSCPIYFTPGNHDIVDQSSAKLWYKMTGSPPYYSFHRNYPQENIRSHQMYH